MNSRELNELLLSNFPELRVQYNEEVSWQEGDDTGAHVVYGDVLYPFLTRAIDTLDPQTIKKAFDFLEYALSFNDKYFNEVIAFSILEPLADDLQMARTIRPFMQDKVNTIFDQIICAHGTWKVGNESMGK